MSFWTSTNTKRWIWVSDFNNIPGLPSYVKGWEVPDFFELPIEETEETKWVMLVTPAPGSPAGGNKNFAITGSFDGTSFSADPFDAEAMWLEYGRDVDGALS